MASRGVPSLFGPIWAAATFTKRGMAVSFRPGSGVGSC
jgi:hypothetical protein